MDKKQAWNNFEHTGKVEDYIKYTQIRDQTELPAGASAVEVPSVFPVEVRDADQDRGPHRSGTDHRGERQAHHDPNA